MNPLSVKALEEIANNLSKAGWSWGCVSAFDDYGRTVWIVDAHGHGKRLVVRADEILAGFLELESAIRSCGKLGLTSRRDFHKTARR